MNKREKDIRRRARADLESAIAPAFAEYCATEAPAREARDKAIAAAGEAYQEAIAPAWKTFMDNTAPAREACDKAIMLLRPPVTIKSQGIVLDG